jgi:hypothetical protein
VVKEERRMSYTKSMQTSAEEIKLIKGYLGLRTLDELRKSKVKITKEERSLRAIFKHLEYMYGAKEEFYYSPEIYLKLEIEPLVKISKRKTTLIEPIGIIRLSLSEKDIYSNKMEKRVVSFLRNWEDWEERQIVLRIKEIMRERRLNEIFKNVSSGIFKIEDAKDFVETWSEVTFKEACERIWEAYRWKLLIPIIAGEERIVILGILSEKSGSYNGKQLRQDVQSLCPVRPIIYELAIESLVKDGYITFRRSFFGDQYEITEKGKVAALLTRRVYQEITKSEVRSP